MHVFMNCQDLKTVRSEFVLVLPSQATDAKAHIQFTWKNLLFTELRLKPKLDRIEIHAPFIITICWDLDRMTFWTKSWLSVFLVQIRKHHSHFVPWWQLEIWIEITKMFCLRTTMHSSILITTSKPELPTDIVLHLCSAPEISLTTFRIWNPQFLCPQK